MRGGKTSAGPQPHGNCGIEVPARNRAQRIGARHHRETERQRNSQQSGSHFGKSRCEYRAAAAPQNEPARADEFRSQLRQHDEPPLVLFEPSDDPAHTATNDQRPASTRLRGNETSASGSVERGEVRSASRSRTPLPESRDGLLTVLKRARAFAFG